jgi:two-component sensor histidine kinase
VALTGPAILLPAHTVVPLSMALHELTTNAAKYGALSGRRGDIDISWRLAGSLNQVVELTWQEHDGPAVKRAKSPGFGTKLIQRVVSHDLDGTTQFDFDPAGVRVSVKFPVRGLSGPVTTLGPAPV